MFNGRRQPSCDGTSRMMREYQVRICEGLGVKFPGPTRHSRPGRARIRSSYVCYVHKSGVKSGRVAVGAGCEIPAGGIGVAGRAANSPTAAVQPLVASRQFHASLLRWSRFGPPAASDQPPRPPCVAMVGIGGCCKGTFCRLYAALPSICQQMPIGAGRLGPCHPRCLSAFR